MVELGCGDSSKTAILLEVAMRGRRGAGQLRFCGVDCSAEALRQTQRNLRRLLPQLPEEQASAGWVVGRTAASQPTWSTSAASRMCAACL